MTDPMPTAWYPLPTEEVLRRLEVDGARGLDEDEVAHRRQRYGLNRSDPRKGKGPVALFLSQFHHPLIYILLAAGVVTAGARGAGWTPAVIFGVVLINAVIGLPAGSQGRAAPSRRSRRALVTEATVRARREDAARALAPNSCPGDVVLLAVRRQGARRPAPGRARATCRSTSPR
ncbi:MAG: cation-transporting P-type ATPase [Chromatiales bacterium]|nr:cation-transporting P-type ATPase [Chromatiales bacterium]